SCLLLVFDLFLRRRPPCSPLFPYTTLFRSFTAAGFAIGAWTGHKGQALAAASAVAVVTFLVNGFGDLVTVVERIRFVSPWHWYAGGDPLSNGFTLQATLLPLVVTAVIVALGCWRLDRRDLR